MKLSAFLIIAAVVHAGLALGLLLVPAHFTQTYGVALDDGGSLVARGLRAALPALALKFRCSGASRPVRSGVTSPAGASPSQPDFTYNVIDPVIVLLAKPGWNDVEAWMVSRGLHVLLAVGFGHYGCAHA
jgi:hypothetical protein